MRSRAPFLSRNRLLLKENGEKIKKSFLIAVVPSTRASIYQYQFVLYIFFWQIKSKKFVPRHIASCLSERNRLLYFSLVKGNKSRRDGKSLKYCNANYGKH